MMILEKTATRLTLKHRPRSLWLFTGSWVLGIPVFIMLIGMIHTWLFYFWWFPLFLIFLIISDIFLLISSGQSYTCIFDKSIDRVTLKQHSLFDRKTIVHSLAEILDVQVESTSSNPDKYTNYEIFMILRTGNALLLELGASADYKKQQETVETIRRFIRQR